MVVLNDHTEVIAPLMITGQTDRGRGTRHTGVITRVTTEPSTELFNDIVISASRRGYTVSCSLYCVTPLDDIS